MTLDVALTIASKRDVELWPMCVAGSAGWSPDSLRETALDILTTEVERLRAMRCETCVHQKVSHGVSDYISMDHWEGRTLKAEAERDALREQVASERADHERIEEALKDEYHLLREQVAEREEAAFRAGHEQGRRHDLWVNADEALAAWQARQKGTPT